MMPQPDEIKLDNEDTPDTPAPRVSVVMSVYNDDRYLERAIRSILSQSFSDFELIIINDGATDCSPDIINRMALQDSRIVVLNQANQGLVAALNRGIAVAKAPLIARMDSDDIAHKDRLALQLQRMDADRRIGVLGTQIEMVDEMGGELSSVFYPLTHEDFPSDLRSPLFCHPSVIMRRDLLLAVGGYRAAFKRAQDLDLWLRLYTMCRFENLPYKLLTYQKHASQISSIYQSQQLLSAEIAHASLNARRAGRYDPMDDATALPDLADIDVLFAEEGLARRIRGSVAAKILASPSELKGAGFAIIHDHALDLGPGCNPKLKCRLWRTCLRLAKLGQFSRSVRLMLAILAKRTD